MGILVQTRMGLPPLFRKLHFTLLEEHYVSTFESQISERLYRLPNNNYTFPHPRILALESNINNDVGHLNLPSTHEGGWAGVV